MTWLSIDDAPIDVVGHAWDSKYPDRTDFLAVVREYDNSDGSKARYVVGHGNTGMNFTLWHPLPGRPNPINQEASHDQTNTRLG